MCTISKCAAPRHALARIHGRTSRIISSTRGLSTCPNQVQARQPCLQSAVSLTRQQHQLFSDAEASDRWSRGLALAAAAALAGIIAPRDITCEGAPPQYLQSPSGLQLRSFRQEKDVSIISIDVENDRQGLLSEVTDLLQKKDLDIRDAKIKTDRKSGKAHHEYTVQDRLTGAGLSKKRLAEVRSLIENLGEDVVATAKAWPVYTQAEIARHTCKQTGIWVSYKDGVYDITDFIENHPGGQDKIMLAAGKAIDPFWRIYQQHEGRGNALTQLAGMRIGDLADPPKADKSGDPYDADPDRHPGLKFHNNKPCNAEIPIELMMDNWLTPNPVWFIRHHHPVPVIDAEQYKLNVEGAGANKVTLSLDDLKRRFLKREVVSTIQCGGNRRSELDKVEKTSGIPWGFGAMSTARWGGVYLREVLQHCAGVSLEAVDFHGIKHVIFHGVDDMQASIPIEKALSPYGDVLLAYEMNDEPLPAEHGYPLRIVVPGVVGVRNVKWVGRITVSKEEAEGTWQRGIAYKGFSPNVKDVSGIDLSQVLSIQEMPVQSAIISPKDEAVIELDDIEVKGFAWSGGGRGIVRVDVSIDDGKNWITAELGEGKDQHPTRAWAWTFWEASIPVPDEMKGKKIEVLCRATDSAYSTQPEHPGPIWNIRGLNCNCWHRVNVKHEE